MPPLALIPAGLQFLGGLGQSIFSGVGRKQRELERFSENSPKYEVNPSILDYYNKALARYSPNAFTSAAYQQGQQNIGSNLATGIAATQDRRSGLGSIGSLVEGANRASLANVAKAEGLQGQALGQLGSAARAKLGEDRMAFKTNVQDPFERKYNLLAMKAAQAAKTQNMGLQNIFGGIGNASSIFAGMGGNKSLSYREPAATDTVDTIDYSLPSGGGTLMGRTTPNFGQ